MNIRILLPVPHSGKEVLETYSFMDAGVCAKLEGTAKGQLRAIFLQCFKQLAVSKTSANFGRITTGLVFVVEQSKSA